MKPSLLPASPYMMQLSTDIDSAMRENPPKYQEPSPFHHRPGPLVDQPAVANGLPRLVGPIRSLYNF